MNTAPNPCRRQILQAGGGMLLLALASPRTVRANDVVEITMAGTGNGAHVWFSPRGILIKRGQTIKWVNGEAGNVHTVTAYHPSYQGKALRIPQGAKPWDSGYLLPGESFSMTFDIPGVYDYFCVPHEHAGMVGRIIVDTADAEAQARLQATNAMLPAAALAGFVPVEQIMKAGKVS